MIDGKSVLPAAPSMTRVRGRLPDPRAVAQPILTGERARDQVRPVATGRSGPALSTNDATLVDLRSYTRGLLVGISYADSGLPWAWRPG